MKKLLFLFCLLLAGCNSPAVIRPLGDTSYPPQPESATILLNGIGNRPYEVIAEV